MMAGHLIAVEIDDWIGDLDFLHDSSSDRTVGWRLDGRP